MQTPRKSNKGAPSYSHLPDFSPCHKPANSINFGSQADKSKGASQTMIELGEYI